MKNRKELWVILVFLAAVVTTAGLSVGRAMDGGYAHNIFATDSGLREISWGIAIGKKAELRNTIEVPLEQAELLDVTYSSKNIYVYPAEGDKIIIKEYLISDKESAKADCHTEKNRTSVTGGEMAEFCIYLFSFGNQEEHIDLYVPQQGMKELQIKTSSGNVTADDFEEYVCDSLSAQTSSGDIAWSRTRAREVDMNASSGNIKLDNMSALEDFSAVTSSGNINAENISGVIEISASSGNVAVENLDGSGELMTTSGNVHAEITSVTGDIGMKASSGNISLEIPSDTSFHFQADTSSGDIHTDFESSLSYNKKGNSAEGDVGSNPEYRVEMKATSGNVRVVRK